MICNTIGLTTDSFETLYVHGGAEVYEVYGGLNYAQPIFYSLKTLTGTTPLYFNAYAEPLKDYTVSGNSYQNGVPDPEHPIEVVSVGDKTLNLLYLYKAGYRYDNSGSEIQAASANIYAFGVESGNTYTINAIYGTSVGISTLCIFGLKQGVITTIIAITNVSELPYTISVSNDIDEIRLSMSTGATSVMCNAGSTDLPYEPYGYKIPVTCGGVTQNIYISEPLRKALDGSDAVDDVNYATQTLTRRVDGNFDELATPTTESITLPEIPTTLGANTLSIGTSLQPSEVSITGHIKPTGYGQLTDSNNVDVLDSNGTPIFVHGQGGTS